MQNPEHALLPFQTSSLPPGPWLVFAPHADDETFGMGGSLLKASAAAIDTHLVVMTDGALGGTDPDLVSIRQREVQEATRLLGIATLHCWQEPDRGLRVCSRLIEKIASLIEQLEPASVFFPGMLEPHVDHRSAALLVWDALRLLASRGPAPQPYCYEITAQNPINRLVDITSEWADKEKVMAVYRSQNRENDYPRLILALDKARTFTLPEEVAFAEGFYCYSPGHLKHSLQEVTRAVIELYLQR